MNYTIQQAWHKKMLYRDIYLVQVAEHPAIPMQADPKIHYYFSLNNGTDGSWRIAPSWKKVKKSSSLEDRLQNVVRSFKKNN